MINEYSNEHNYVKNPNWQEADQLAKSSREVELGVSLDIRHFAHG